MRNQAEYNCNVASDYNATPRSGLSQLFNIKPEPLNCQTFKYELMREPQSITVFIDPFRVKRESWVWWDCQVQEDQWAPRFVNQMLHFKTLVSNALLTAASLMNLLESVYQAISFLIQLKRYVLLQARLCCLVGLGCVFGFS